MVIIVIAADDDIMPQTKEAISHAQAASVPIVFAINKIDSPNANPDKIKEGLSAMNLLVEDWGGKIQSHDVSAKQGTGISELLEKVMLEAELLEVQISLFLVLQKPCQSWRRSSDIPLSLSLQISKKQ